MRLILFLLAIWLPVPVAAQPRVDLKFDFGAVCDGVADDTAAVSAWLMAGRNAQLQAPRGRCRLTSPLPATGFPIWIEGAGIDVTTFVRDFNGTTGQGVFTLAENSRGSVLRGFSVISAAGRTGGHALVIRSTSDYTAGNTVIDGVKFSSDGQNSWFTTVRLDGTARTLEPRGVRGVTFSNTHIFGAEYVSLELATVIGFSFNGGGIYPASGTSRYSGGLQIRGSSAFPSQYISINLTTVGLLNLSDVIDAAISSPVIGIGNGYAVENAGSALRVAVRGQPYPGAGIPNSGVMSNWIGSSLTLPSGAVTQ